MAAVIYEKKGNIAYVTINRSEALNAMNQEVWRGLEEALVKVRDDVEVRAAIITGAGEKAFSVGADVKEISEPIQTSIKALSSPLDMILSLKVWTPIIAAINGYCLGDGFFLALFCDIRIASEESIFGIPEVSLGICPDRGVTQWLPQLIPGSIALELLLTGERFPASDAYRFGLINKIVPQSDLISAAETLGHKISNNGPLAVKSVKRAFWQGLRANLDEGLRLEKELSLSTLQSIDAKEAMRAFSQKRKPLFQGK